MNNAKTIENTRRSHDSPGIGIRISTQATACATGKRDAWSTLQVVDACRPAKQAEQTDLNHAEQAIRKQMSDFYQALANWPIL
jgi:hypothetical protein